jgi:hypothetical protein
MHFGLRFICWFIDRSNPYFSEEITQKNRTMAQLKNWIQSHKKVGRGPCQPQKTGAHCIQAFSISDLRSTFQRFPQPVEKESS